MRFNATVNMWKARFGGMFGWILAMMRAVGICFHDWTDIKEVRVYPDGRRNGLPIGTKYVQRCEHCKKYRSFLI